MRISRSGEVILAPPQLPDYLSALHDLKPIIGKPEDKDVKAIHAVLRALDSVAHLPTFYNPDLSMQLSQHLFGAQMAVFKASYAMSLVPGHENVFTPPDLPSHIPGTLNRVIGVPSDEEIKSVQSVLRSVENLANSPQLFDADLSMNINQHLFNIQYARYIHDSSEGKFVPEAENEPEQPRPPAPQPTQAQEFATNDWATNPQSDRSNHSSASEAGQVPGALSGLVQLGETIVRTINDASKESKDLLENVNRILVSMKVGCMSEHYHIFKNPLNRKGVLASECGLPNLRYWYYNKTGKFEIWHNSDEIARYLKFFEIGDDLIQGDEEPKLIDGKYGEAEKLLLAQAGFGHA